VIRLHDNLSSGNGYKVRLLLAQLDIPFERVEYDIDADETRAPEFLQKVNPNGRVPVLELEDGTTLPESNAILFYLAEYTPFLPEGRLERAQVLRWMFFEQYGQFATNHGSLPAERRDGDGVGAGLASAIVGRRVQARRSPRNRPIVPGHRPCGSRGPRP
jgi:glutathione S-transferase